jgi:endonuclease/exonuclease/phosphatase family metal-dependent hydrolase
LTRMGGKPFRVLQANLRKMPEAQHALMNDEDLQDISIILVQEPSCFTTEDGQVVAAPTTHTAFQQFIPNKRHEELRFPIRSLIYASHQLRARQIEIQSPDITAIEVEAQGREILAFSIYMQGQWTSAEESRSQAERILNLIRITILQFPTHEVIVAGDFNRHDQLWGGETVRRNEGEPIVQFMHEHGLQLMLKRGTPTHESGTTIDLSMASTKLFEDMVKCTIWPTEYGSDHKAVESQFDLNLYDSTNEPRRLFRKTNWKRAT